jgi:hypothetical protein
MPVLVPLEVAEPLGRSGQDPVFLAIAEQEVQGSQRHRAFDDDVVDGDGLHLRVDVARIRAQPVQHLHQPPIEQFGERFVAAVASVSDGCPSRLFIGHDHFTPQRVEELHVPRLVHLLRCEKRGLLVVSRREENRCERVGNAVFGGEERRQAVNEHGTLVFTQPDPVASIAREIDRAGGPVVLLPAEIELSRRDRLQMFKVRVFDVRRIIALAVIERDRHEADLRRAFSALEGPAVCPSPG